MLRNRGVGTFALAIGLLCAVRGGLEAQAGTTGPRELLTISVQAEGEVLEPERAADGWSMRDDQIAWGEGTVSGEFRGDIDFSLLAKKPRRDRPMDVRFVGWLFPPDGAELMYEAEGWAVPSASDPSEWFVTARVGFPSWRTC